jgi:hypothetical protein
MDPQTRLLVLPDTVEAAWDENGTGLFVIAPDTAIPQRIDALFQDGQVNSSYYSVSPNGQWIVFNRRVTGQEIGTGWISSIDGQQQWPLSDDLRVGHWLDDNTVVLVETEGEFRFDAEREFRGVINPFTMEAEPLSNLPETQVTGIGAVLFQAAGHTLMLYQAGYDYRLFDASTQTDQQVLEWLSSEAVPFLDKSIYATTSGQIVIKVVRPYGFDMSPLMDINEIITSESYTQTMQPVIVPKDVLPVHPSLESTNTLAMSFYQDSEENPQSAPKFYWFDYQQQIIKDYCFAPQGFASLSLDDKFVAFTRLHLPSQAPVPKSIFILNLETGHIAQIDDYQFAGWAQADK